MSMNGLSNAQGRLSRLVGEWLFQNGTNDGTFYIKPHPSGVRVIGHWHRKGHEHVVRTSVPYGATLDSLTEIMGEMWISSLNTQFAQEFQRSEA